MNKRTSTTAKVLNYPDVLGTITNQQRLILNALQIAVAVRPAMVNAGKPVEMLMLMQNTLNIDVDALIKLIVPEKDLSGTKARITTNMWKPVRIGLRSGEVGCATFPAMIMHQTTPGEYTFELEITVEQKGRNSIPLRDANGGAAFDLGQLPTSRRPFLDSIQGLEYSVNTVGKPTATSAKLMAQFQVLPAAVAGLQHDIKPSYITVWSADDFIDEAALAQKVKPLTDKLLPKFSHESAFIPLLKATQTHFEGAGYRLWAGEAVAITKLLTMALESDVMQIKTGTSPAWYFKLCRALADNPKTANALEMILSDLLYVDLAGEAARLAFSKLADALQEEVGTDEEIGEFIEKIVRSLNGQGEPITMARTYMPLVMGGIVCNTLITMPGEQVQETASMIAYAIEHREGERNDENGFVFDIANDLVSRALEHF